MESYHKRKEVLREVWKVNKLKPFNDPDLK